MARRTSQQVVAPPVHLDEIGRQKWGEVFAIIQGRGDTLDAGTLDAVEAYTVAYSQWLAAQAKVAELGAVIKSATGFAIVSPYVAVAAQAERRMRQWATELKLTPKAQARRQATADAEDQGQGILRLLGGKKRA